jgi:DNA polymerase-1
LFGSAGFDEISDLQIALAYAAKDGDVTRKLRDFQRDHLRRFPEMLAYYESVEVPLIKTIVHMESTGYDIDTEYAARYGNRLKVEIDQLHKQLTDVLGDINVDSPLQLKPALSRAIGEQLESTDAKKVLKPLAHKHPIIQTLLDYKAKVKLYSTYINVLPDLIDKRTGKLHANFNGNGAKTGRMSSGGDGGNGGSVNLQNQPKDARKLFVAPPGYVIIGADWSQQEYRCLAYLTGEPLLVNAYREGVRRRYGLPEKGKGWLASNRLRHVKIYSRATIRR